MPYIDIDIEITDCIERIETGEKLNTTISKVIIGELSALSDFEFNWCTEFNDNTKEVYKLTINDNPDEILGLISLSLLKEDKFVFIHLVERKDYKGKKIFNGIGGNLFAFACKFSFDNEGDGYVCFDAKTNLVEHYKERLGAERIGESLRMIIDKNAASKLVKRYFKEK
jgi:hypothetical protein